MLIEVIFFWCFNWSKFLSIGYLIIVLVIVFFFIFNKKDIKSIFFLCEKYSIILVII